MGSSPARERDKRNGMELQSLTSDTKNARGVSSAGPMNLDDGGACNGDFYSLPEDYDHPRRKRRSLLIQVFGGRPLTVVVPALALLLLGAMLLWATTPPRPRKLQFRVQKDDSSNNQQPQVQTFKILQLADLHIGEAEHTDWGPQQDAKTWKALDAIIASENSSSSSSHPIDLIVLSGDQLTANDMHNNATTYYRQLCNHLVQYHIPWAMIFGNHDDQPNVWTQKSKYSRLDLYNVDQQYAPLSLTQRGPSSIFGVSNYILNVYYPTSSTSGGTASDATSDDVALQILFLDSGGGLLPLQVEQDQIDWLLQERQPSTLAKPVPMVAFQHIPTLEFRQDFTSTSNCQGTFEDGGVANVTRDAGMVTALLHLGQVHFLAVGHNHGNDYCCRYSPTQQASLHVCFGRHSGYGGYGTWDRGGRVYELTLTGSSATKNTSFLTWKSWVRMESGEIMDEYDPNVNYEGGGGDENN